MTTDPYQQYPPPTQLTPLPPPLPPPPPPPPLPPPPLPPPSLPPPSLPPLPPPPLLPPVPAPPPPAATPHPPLAAPRQPTSPGRTAPPAPPGGPGRLYLVLAVVLSAAFMQLLDVSIVSVAIPPVQADLGATGAQLELVVGGYLLTFACALLVGGRLGDTYGRKRLFLIGMAGFTAASAGCGLAPEPISLIVARLAQGLFSGLMFPQVLSIIQVTFPPYLRGRVYGIYGATLAVASILGPLLGGLLVQADLFGLGWRTIFLVNLPIGLAAMVLGVPLLTESTARDPRRVDLAGAMFVTVGLFLVVLPLTVGREAGWPPWTYLMLTAGVGVLIPGAVHQRRRSRWHQYFRHADPPLIPWSLFWYRSFTVGLLLNLVFFLGVAAFFFYFVIYLQTGAGYSAWQSGLTVAPVALAAALASGASERLGPRAGRTGLAVGCALLTVGMGALTLTLSQVGDRPSAWWFVPALVPVGLGLGLFGPLVVSVVLADIGEDEAGAASGAVATMQQIGGAVGIAVVGALFFGLIGANAREATGAGAAPLEGTLAAAGLPAPAVTSTVADFRTCFADRARHSDPAAVPPSCRRAEQALARNLESLPEDRHSSVLGALDTAARGALARDMRRSTAQTTVYEVVVFATAFLLVLALPRYPAAGPAARRDRDGGHSGPPGMAG